MAAPNLASLTTITAKTGLTDLNSTSATTLLSNAASSGKVLKLSSLYVCNVDGTSNADITIKVHSAAAGGGTGFAIASTIVVPADGSAVIIDKNSPVYLEEDKSLVATASAGGDLECVLSYEELS